MELKSSTLLFLGLCFSQSTLEEEPYKIPTLMGISRSVYRAPLLDPSMGEKPYRQLDLLTGNRGVCRAVDQPVVASWYGPRFHGRPMANGERFNMYDPAIVAHKKLPLGTRLRLTRVKTGKSIIVVVKDRGPFIAGREFDLSRAAAEKLGFVKEGLASVVYQVLWTPPLGAPKVSS